MSRIPAGVKLGVLFCAGIGLYLITAWPVLAGLLALAIALLLWTREPLRRLARPIGGLLIIIAVVVIMTGLTTGWQPGLVAGLRLTTLCLLAYAITLSTPFAQFLELFERLLAPTARIGLNPARISLALALTVRFIPTVRATYDQIREAQHARGQQRSPLALLVPLVVRTLQSAEQISEAIDARAYDTAPTVHRDRGAT